jgi:mitochondrial fission protein ELM1
MKILWLKDQKVGHEKQVLAILKRLQEKIPKMELIEIDVNISFIKNLLLFLSKIHPSISLKPDVIIGAGTGTHLEMLRIKQKFNNEPKIICVMKPSIFLKQFDLVFAPRHDFNNEIPKNVFVYQGSIVEPKIYDDLDDNILVLIGGENKHFPFCIEKILNQIKFIESNNEFTNKKILIFNSRRTPEKLNTVLKDWSKQSNNLNFMDYQNSVSLSNYMGKSSYTFVTPDSVNMIFESLSSLSKTYVFSTDTQNDTKVTKLIKNLVNNNSLGCIEKNDFPKDSYFIKHPQLNLVLNELKKIVDHFLNFLQKQNF